MINSVLEYLFECVKKHPQKRAVSYRDHFVTFAELEQKAKRYGQAILKTLPNTDKPNPIGVICSRDVEPIVAFLGVIYSGNFYVPLDPNAPKDKLRSIIEDSGMKIIIGSCDNSMLIENVCFDGTFIVPSNIYDSNQN